MPKALRQRGASPTSLPSGLPASAMTAPSSLEVLHKSRLDQQAVEAPRLGAVLAGIEQALAAEHDILLLLKGGIKGNAGRLLHHQRQIGRIDRIHDRGTLHRLEIDGVDRVVGAEIA